MARSWWLLGLVLAGAVAPACIRPKPVAEGEACALATDCDEGLICVPTEGDNRVCRASTDGLGEAPAGPADGAAGEVDGGRDAAEPRDDAEVAAGG